MRKIGWTCAAALLAAGCNQSPASNADTKTAAAEQPAKPKVNHYCFFKKDAQKGWAARRDSSGNVVVSGKAQVDDVRNKGALGQPDVSGTSAVVWLTMTSNTSYAAPGNWWDVSFTIPNSAGVTDVAVKCDADRTFAELKVKPARG